jgi:hypothetical protein
MSVDVSTKRPGKAEPAMHHTMSGAMPLFHALVSVITRWVSAEEERSADMKWKLWEDVAAEAWKD